MKDRFKVRITDAGVDFEGRVGESILDAALRQGINLPHGCQNGGCGQCAASLLAGECLNGGEQVTARDGDILTCQALPQGYIELSLGATPELLALDVKTLPAKVDQIEMLGPEIARVMLRYPPRETFEFLPGQFIDLHWQGIHRSYSIASHSSDSKRIELQISAVEGGCFTSHVFNAMKPGELLRFEGPLGAFYVRQNIKPLLFITGGTGFAPVQAIILQLLERGDQRPIYLYWGNRQVEDFYSSLPEEWAQQHTHVHYVPVLSGQGEWGGRRGRAQQAVGEDFDTLAGYDVYACGAPKMVEAARELCYAKGVKSDDFFADPFTHANR